MFFRRAERPEPRSEMRVLLLLYRGLERVEMRSAETAQIPLAMMS
jgi:hypothetical protein